MGNVLVIFDPEKSLSKRLNNPEDINELLDKFYRASVYRDCDRGVKTFREAIDEVAPKLSSPRLKLVLEDLYINQSFGKSEMPPCPEMYDLIIELKKNGYKTYLLSNAGFDFYDYSPYIPAIGVMDGKIVSCDYKILKPEPGIYEALFNKYSIIPSESLFIDDTKENVESGERFGMKGICFSQLKSNVDELKDKLRSFGVRI